MAIAINQIVFAPTGTTIRTEVNNNTVVESREAMLLRQSPFKLSYGFPKEVFDKEMIEKSGNASSSGRLGTVQHYDLIVGNERRSEALSEYIEAREDAPDLRGYFFLSWNAADRWFEETEEMIGHPRDPFTRIDVRRASYHIEVQVDGVTVAESSRAFALLETGLPVRYYIPREDISWRYLRDSETESVCPYKGRSRYWHVQTSGTVHEDLAWAYPEPLQDATQVKDALCFYQEKLTLYLDGKEEPKPPKYFTK